jgi:hypothetical protein
MHLKMENFFPRVDILLVEKKKKKKNLNCYLFLFLFQYNYYSDCFA